MADIRLTHLRSVAKWFEEWEKDVMSLSLDNKQKNCALLSRETRDDTQCCIIGFISMCQLAIEKHGNTVVPSMVNSDVIENTFCQQRATNHGANTHPDYRSYTYGINNIILTQSTISPNSNTGGTGASCYVTSSGKSLNG